MSHYELELEERRPLSFPERQAAQRAYAALDEAYGALKDFFCSDRMVAAMTELAKAAEDLPGAPDFDARVALLDAYEGCHDVLSDAMHAVRSAADNQDDDAYWPERREDGCAEVRRRLMAGLVVALGRA